MILSSHLLSILFLLLYFHIALILQVCYEIPWSQCIQLQEFSYQPEIWTFLIDHILENRSLLILSGSVEASQENLKDVPMKSTRYNGILFSHKKERCCQLHQNGWIWRA